MLLRCSLVCREGGGAPVGYGIHICGFATYRELVPGSHTQMDNEDG
jgi:hypothetical protein